MPDLRIEKVVVTGGREFTDGARIEADLRALVPLGLRRLAHGGATGADALADAAARRVMPLECFQRAGSGVALFEPNWKDDGRRAGLVRNIRMLNEEHPDLVLAYPDPLSRGTWHCVKAAIGRGLTVAVWTTAARLVAAGLSLLMMPDEPDRLEHFVFAQDPARVPDYLEVLGA